MASGWAHEGAVQEQIDATVNSAVERARSRLTVGDSLEFCEECDAEIPEKRRNAIPGVRLCIACQSELESSDKAQSLYNRSGSKDSQLR
ncbi:RNA polymerase-binding transcription factor DksA [Marinomonas gallaica]|uniref:RNA polymerase-binding transcription factor DksA n=1 Tax=Marinomonas gallaica TaxID=1806667 RepID=A0A1C3JQU8_9GAMM|nr:MULTISPECIES: DksA/TraR family C4-type zinc finger protein [Marinomonas]MCO4786592.1 DksA/TraR family C4-type zinc finger protein [Marinomonas atlantica]SBT17487.1 RNA polymerase-binding transcription factor DksA [Marinomonas gallaica]SBT19679.1 RNA polymerase-binding transcription factor DksA [Marinomonas gallaica]